jgi:hypothetical protein
MQNEQAQTNCKGKMIVTNCFECGEKFEYYQDHVENYCDDCVSDFNHSQKISSCL